MLCGVLSLQSQGKVIIGFHYLKYVRMACYFDLFLSTTEAATDDLGSLPSNHCFNMTTMIGLYFAAEVLFD